MDNKLKDAIAAVRSGDTYKAQEQLTTLLAENPEEPQGWYLLSLLVDSPQKQAAYLSKTLALDPQHQKAQEQLAALQQAGTLAPTATFAMEPAEPMDVLAQSETDTLPSWLEEEGGTVVKAQPVADMTDTAVPTDDLPDWLVEPSALSTDKAPVDEAPTVVGHTTEEAQDEIVAVATPKPAAKVTRKPAKPKPAAGKSTTGLNVVLGVLVLLAVVVMVLLAYLILG